MYYYAIYIEKYHESIIASLDMDGAYAVLLINSAFVLFCLSIF